MWRVEHREVKPSTTWHKPQQEISHLGQLMVPGSLSGKREEQEVELRLYIDYALFWSLAGD
jgi:hypothetical protein